MRPFVTLAAFALLGAPSMARAYTFDSPVSHGCHEAITTRALRAVRAGPGVPAAVPDRDEAALIDDLPFHVDDDVRDLEGATLLLAVRDNDLEGKGAFDADALAEVHGDPSSQVKHCLRDREDDGDGGTLAAITRCRAWIRARALEALDGLDARGMPDASTRAPLAVTLATRGAVTPTLPLYWVRVGQASHALQDSFTHTYRTDDGHRITVALNWIDLVDGDLDERRDGPPHMSELDLCGQIDSIRSVREALATEATTELLRATLGPSSRASKEAAVDAVLDRFLGVAPGCTFDNAWCDAKEPSLSTSSACDLRAGARAASPWPWAAALLGLGAVIARRRARVAAVVTFAAIASAPSMARADVASASESERWGDRSRLGAYASVGGAIDHAALAGSIAARWRFHDAWLAGADLEWNPWASFVTDRVRPGSLNAYATLVHRWPMQHARVDLRTTVHFGASRILFDLYGVPNGTTGLFAGVSLVGLEWRTTSTTSLVIEPAHVMVPIPQIHGAPYAYVQYRFTVGVQWGA